MKTVYLIRIHSYDKPIAFESISDAMRFADMARTDTDDEPSKPVEVLYVPFDSYKLKSTSYANLVVEGGKR